MSSQAPVCPITPEVVVNSPPDPKYLPAVPIATDLQSALDAINALRQIIDALLNRTAGGSQQGNVNRRGGGGGAGGGNKNGKNTGRWREVQRAKQTVRVFNPKDHEQYVDVERINRVVMQDSLTGEQWIWTH